MEWQAKPIAPQVVRAPRVAWGFWPPAIGLPLLFLVEQMAWSLATPAHRHSLAVRRFHAELPVLREACCPLAGPATSPPAPRSWPPAPIGIHHSERPRRSDVSLVQEPSRRMRSRRIAKPSARAPSQVAR